MEKKSLQDEFPEIGTHCWGCGINNEHGLHIKSYWDGDETVCDWKPKKQHLSFLGILNGGIIATLIDCHCTSTAYAIHLKEMGNSVDPYMTSGYVTRSLSINYLKPTPLRKSVHLRARVVEKKEKSMKILCELFSKNQLCATGEVVLVKIGK
ncbi:MAG: PaaI family thioesterase [Candidatus Lokiarchaeota archaeon]|nr:PaaI family thioesterase [Candidatus Lokiarchaeota archaeon]